MESRLEPEIRQRRPGGRTADVTRRVNQAIMDLLVEGGIEACTFSNVAQRAGVERSTLYRRSPDRWQAIVDAIIDFANRLVPAPDTGCFQRDLLATTLDLRDVLTGPLGAPTMAVAAALKAGHAPGMIQRFWENRRLQIKPMFDAAVERGELAPDIDFEKVFAQAAGPIFYRLFVMGAPVDDAFAQAIVDDVWTLHGRAA